MQDDNNAANKPDKVYSETFFEQQSTGSRKASEVVVPLLVERFSPGSVLDVGCGTGVWLNTFKRAGVSTVMGVDGGYTTQRQLTQNEFLEVDLTHVNEIGLHEDKYDLVISLEVAEHLPEEQATQFIKFLCSKSDIVVFSAAIPYQGGHHHLNEKWQSYWRDIFASLGYRPDCSLRPILWSKPDVPWWYAQNITIYQNGNNRMQSDRQFDDSTICPMMNVVHPSCLTKLAHFTDPDNITIRPAAKQLLRSIKQSLKWHLKSFNKST